MQCGIAPRHPGHLPPSKRPPAARRAVNRDSKTGGDNCRPACYTRTHRTRAIGALLVELSADPACSGIPPLANPGAQLGAKHGADHGTYHPGHIRHLCCNRKQGTIRLKAMSPITSPSTLPTFSSGSRCYRHLIAPDQTLSTILSNNAFNRGLAMLRTACTSINCYQTYLSTINPLYKRAARRYSAHEHYFASTVSGGNHILPQQPSSSIAIIGLRLSQTTRASPYRSLCSASRRWAKILESRCFSYGCITFPLA
jgi:hypothetical protein